jgi:hypothetical protein
MSANRRSHNSYQPKVRDQESLIIGPFEINIKRIRCLRPANDIASSWQSLEDDRLPLDDIASTLVSMELGGYIRERKLNALRIPIHVLRIVDAIVACKSIKGFDSRYNSLKSRLRSIINSSRFIPSLTYKTIPDYHNDLIGTLLSTTDEFRLACTIKAMESSLEFTTEKHKKYPDFRIGKYESSIVETSSLTEAKSRLNRSYIGEEIGTIVGNSKIIHLNEQDVVRLLCRDAYTKFESAFDNQHANMIFVNLSHSDYGDIFAAYSITSDKKYELKNAFDAAKKMTQGVVLYTEVFTVRPQDSIGIAAVSLERQTAEIIGKTLDKIEKDYYKDNLVNLDYYELIDRARNQYT